MSAPSDVGCRVGVDLVDIAEVAEAVQRFGDRYLSRVFTDGELAVSVGPPEVRLASLAARFAAKEATIKVLRPPDGAPGWRTIEVVRQPSGACELQLSGAAAALARQAGLGPMTVSLTHHAGLAAAVVVALTGGAAPGTRPRFDPQPLTVLKAALAGIRGGRFAHKEE